VHHVTARTSRAPSGHLERWLTAEVFFRRQAALCFSATSQAGAARGQVNVVTVTTAPLTVGAPTIVLAGDPADGPSFPVFDVAEDGRLLMTRRADPQPGDEARVVLMQNWLAARPPRSANRN
jgi:hypothetical protein